jgi:signal transduction histidine kinase
MQSGRRAWLRTPVALDDLAHQAIERRRAEADAAGVQVGFTAEREIPFLSLDETGIGQAIEELIDNAIRCSPAGAAVSVLSTLEGDQVWDLGAGIAPEDLPKIFDPFFRGQSGPTSSGPGAGLGLTLAKRVIEAHGGALLVTSALGHGSRFSVRFPLAETEV